MAADPGSSPRSLMPFDVVGLAFGGLGLLWTAVVAFQIAPHFAKLLAELGGDPPLFTSLCLSRWFQVMGLAPLVVVGCGIAANATEGTRLVLMGLAILLTLALPAVFFIGVYLPIFDMAGAVGS